MSTTAATTEAHDEQADSAPRYDDVNTPVIWLVAITSVLATFLTIALVQGMYYQWQSAYLKKRELQYELVNPVAKQEIVSQQAMLDGSVEGTISIDEAMKKVIAQYGNKTENNEQTETSTN